MTHKRFSVYDSKAAAYLPEFLHRTTALAIRSFSTAANKEEHDFKEYAADYTLFEVGTWDDTTCRSTDLEAHINLGTALSHMDQVPALELARTERGN